MASLNSIYERLGSVRVTEAQRREAETALMWVEVIADVILRTASEIRRTVARVTQGIGKLIDGLSRSPARPRRRDSENLAGASVCDASHMDENVKKFMTASAAALSIDWPFPDGKNGRLRVVEVLFQPDAAHKRRHPRTKGGNRSEMR